MSVTPNQESREVIKTDEQLAEEAKAAAAKTAEGEQKKEADPT
jgi:hypothetical protein